MAWSGGAGYFGAFSDFGTAAADRAGCYTKFQLSLVVVSRCNTNGLMQHPHVSLQSLLLAVIELLC